MMKKIDHPHIYKVFDVLEYEDTFYLISEYLEGGEFFYYLSEKKKLNENETYVILEILLQTISYLHCNNITHRDLKPENLMFSTKNDIHSLKLIDFASATFNQEG
jgi:serine/threonine protein kinase